MKRDTRWSVLVVCLFLVGLLPLSTSGGIAGAGTHKVLVDHADGKTQTLLAQSGARLLVDYDAFSLWEVPDSKIQGFVGRASVQQRDDFDDIYVRTGKITTPSSVPPAPANLRQSKVSGNQLWMVQFVGPIKTDWLDNLHALGVEIVIYMPNNAYVVWADGAGVARLETLAAKDPTVQWTGAYEPAYRLEPSLQRLSGAQMTPVTIQFYRTANTAASLASVQAFGGTVIKSPEEILAFTNITLTVPASELVKIANRADVFNVEPFVAPQRRDEVQDQIVAGNLTTSGTNVVPSGTGYLAWLDSMGFPHTPSSYPMVDVTDDGIDNGTTSPLHPDFHELGLIGNPSRLIFNGNCTADASGDGKAGHGNINTGIVGAYDNLTGSPSVDANGYRIGLGVSPYTRLAGTKIFNNAGKYDINACGGTDAGVVADAYNNGATFTSNSWGANVAGAYDSSSQAYDALTRDASTTTAGNQQMLHVFAAGNAGSGTRTVGSPGSAKNVLTVGATENVREDGVADGCGYNGGASADNIATFSSRGPTSDGRVKPDIMAPGTHVQGPASQDPGYDGSGVCDKYHPAGQTLYAMSTGTSHSTPATAGAVSLLYNYYGRVLKPGQTPSPAMLKALLLNTPRYLNGTDAGGNLPSNNQGWGDVDLGTLFDSANTRYLIDQSNTFTATGQAFGRTGTIADPTKPVRVTLAWTDAPGSTTGNAYVNDLNLEVTVGGVTYKGNVFSGANSTTGGTADAKDNVENVFLPAGTSGAITVKVTAANLAGKAVPGGPGTVNQDFALVISDSAIVPGAALAFGTPPATFSDAAPGGNGDGVIDPGETIALTVPLLNSGDGTATAINGTLTTGTATIAVLNGTSAYADIAPGATGNGNAPLTFRVSKNMICGASLDLSLSATYNSGLSVTTTFSLVTGAPPPVPNYASTDVPKAIPDNNAGGITSGLTVAGATGTVDTVVVHLNAIHTYDSDLSFKLIAPDNTAVTLINRRGGSGTNFTGTVLDDSAATAITSITSGGAPFTGTYRPEQPLSALRGKAINGAWQLQAVDHATGDTGSIQSWSLDIRPAGPAYICSGAALIASTPPATFSDAAPGGNGDGVIDPGETIALTVPLVNAGKVTATGISGTLTTSTAAVVIVTGTSAYADIAPGATGSGGVPFTFRVPNAILCGASIDFSLNATYNSGVSVTTTFSLVTGAPSPASSYVSTDVPKAIPDNNATGITSSLTIAGATGTISTVVVHLNATHTWDADLSFKLIAPDSTAVTLINHRGANGDNFTGTVLDDSAAIAVASGVAPFTGTYRPEQPLSAFRGKAINGAWQLQVADNATGDTGTFTGWSLDIRPAVSICAAAIPEATTTAVTNLIAPYSTAAQPIILNAAVASSPPGTVVNEGTITFAVMQGATPIGVAPAPAAVTNGAASASYTLPAGTATGNYTLTATYNPAASNPNFTTSASTGGTLTVNPGTTTAVTNASTSFSSTNQAVALSATVTSAPPGTVVNEGTVTFTVTQGATAIGTAVISGTVANGVGTANYTLPAGTTAGGYTLTATYNPAASNPNFAASTSAGGTLTVAADATTTAVTNATAPFSVTDQAVALNATVASLPPGVAVSEGTVTFAVTQGATTIGTAVTSGAVVNGAAAASYTLPANTPGGVYTITATYNPGTNFTTSTVAGTLTVASGAVAIGPANLPNGIAGTAYSQQLTASGGSGAGYTFAAPPATLPTGLTLSSAGLLAGTPTAAGPFTFTVTVTDGAANVGSQQYTLTIIAATVTPTGVTVAGTGSLGNPPTVRVGQQGQLTATAMLSDHSTPDVTNQVQWSSSDTTIASVDAHGNVTGKAGGAVTITASYTLHGVTKTGSATLTVTAAILTGVQPAPAPSGRPGGASVPGSNSPATPPAPAPTGR